MCVCVCVCVCARARACVRACVRVCVCKKFMLSFLQMGVNGDCLCVSFRKQKFQKYESHSSKDGV